MKLIDTLCENNINTVAEELVSSENITRYIPVVDEVYDQHYANCRATWRYSRSSFSRSI